MRRSALVTRKSWLGYTVNIGTYNASSKNQGSGEPLGESVGPASIVVMCLLSVQEDLASWARKEKIAGPVRGVHEGSFATATKQQEEVEIHGRERTNEVIGWEYVIEATGG